MNSNGSGSESGVNISVPFGFFRLLSYPFSSFSLSGSQTKKALVLRCCQTPRPHVECKRDEVVDGHGASLHATKAFWFFGVARNPQLGR